MRRTVEVEALGFGELLRGFVHLGLLVVQLCNHVRRLWARGEEVGGKKKARKKQIASKIMASTKNKEKTTLDTCPIQNISERSKENKPKSKSNRKPNQNQSDLIKANRGEKKKSKGTKPRTKPEC